MKINTKLIVGFLVVVLLVGIAVYLLVIRPATSIPESIKIGWPVPLTGSIASFGEADPWLAKHIIKIVNEEKGGIYLSEYRQKIPIEILARDTSSDADFAASVAEALILEEKIDLMVVLHTPSMAVPVSSMCEKYKVPCIVFDSPVLAWLEEAPYEWSYLHFWTEPDVAEVHVGMWDLVKEQTNKRAGGLWNDDPDGRTFRKATIAVAEEHGYDFVGDGGLSPYGTDDYSSYITDWMEKDVELLAGNLIPPDFATLWRQCDAMGFHPKVISIGRAILFPPAVGELGSDLPLGLTTEIWWSKYHPAVSPLTGLTPEELANLWKKDSDKQWTQPLFYSLGAFETAIDALERAGSLDKEKIKNAIADTDLDTIVGHVCFKAPLSSEDKKRYEKWPELIEYKSHYSLAPVVGGQWMKGVEWPWEIQIVYNWKYDWIPETAKMILVPE